MAVGVYLDANVLFALFVDDAFSLRTRRYLHDQMPILIVSDFAAAEFAAVLAREVRMKAVAPVKARRTFAVFDEWTARETERVEAMPADLAAATNYLRRLDLALRAPDAINIAICRRLGAALATFDDKMRAAARKMRVALALM